LSVWYTDTQMHRIHSIHRIQIHRNTVCYTQHTKHDAQE